MRTKFIHIILSVFAIAAFGIGQASAQGFQLPNMQVTSNAFEDGGIIPIKYTSHGDNVQPNFSITGSPETTVGFAIFS